MSNKRNYYDNAAMEPFWSIVKHELIFLCMFRTRDEAKAAFFDYIASPKEITHIIWLWEPTRLQTKFIIFK